MKDALFGLAAVAWFGRELVLLFFCLLVMIYRMTDDANDPLTFIHPGSAVSLPAGKPALRIVHHHPGLFLFWHLDTKRGDDLGVYGNARL